MSDFPEAGVDQHVWVIVGKYGNWSFYFDEQYALDNLTRTDKDVVAAPQRLGTEAGTAMKQLLRELAEAFPLRDPAFRWGLLHPFGPPAPWWSDERRLAYFQQHGKPWL